MVGTMRRRLPGVMAGVAAAMSVLASGTPAQAATGKTVPVVWQHQTHEYNCGPAATRIAISTHISSVALPSQETIGSYEGTSRSDGTDRYHVQKGLAHWVPAESYQVVSNANKSGFTAAEARNFHDHLVFDINRNSPAVVNIVVNPGGVRPPGWANPSQQIDHWIVVNGYDGQGNVLVTDPASTGSGFNPQHSYWIPLEKLDKLVLKTYVW